MTKEEIVQLTSGLYKLTILFPKKEPLRYKIREKAEEILEGLILLDFFNGGFITKVIKNSEVYEGVINKLSVLDILLELARLQSWVNCQAVLSFQREYASIRENLDMLKTQTLLFIPASETKSEFQKPNNSISDRQRKILEILKEKEKAQVGEFKKVFPSVTKRTLRRDFLQLFKKGLIKRMGERNETFYRIAQRIDIQTS